MDEEQLVFPYMDITPKGVITKYGYADKMENPITGCHICGYLLGIEILINRPTIITAFGFICGKLNTFPTRVKCGLYSNLNDHPDKLLTFCLPSELVSGGRTEISPVENISVIAGTYWIMATFERNSPILKTLNNNNNNIKIVYITHGFHSSLPDIWPKDSHEYISNAFNYYLVGY